MSKLLPKKSKDKSFGRRYFKGNEDRKYGINWGAKIRPNLPVISLNVNWLNSPTKEDNHKVSQGKT